MSRVKDLKNNKRTAEVKQNTKSIISVKKSIRQYSWIVKRKRKVCGQNQTEVTSQKLKKISVEDHQKIQNAKLLEKN